MLTRAAQRVVSAALLASVLAGSSAVPANAAPRPMEERLIARVNDARTAHGLRRLKVGPRLQRGAHAWAVRLRRTDGFIHSRPAPGTSEVIAWGAPCSWMSPARAVRFWLKSPPHRRAMLDRTARRVGAGYTAGSWRQFGCAELAVARFR